MDFNQGITYLTTTTAGMCLLSLFCSVLSILLIKYVTGFFKWLVKPAIERSFYDSILNKWLGPYLSKHKIVATCLKMLGVGDQIVDVIVHIIGTFFIVAFLSSALTASIIDVSQQGFIYSVYLLWLVSMASMLSWMLCHNLVYFYKFTNRLK